MLSKRTIQRATLMLVGAGALVVAAAATAAGTTTITISHEMRGCHAWAINNGSVRPSLAVKVKAGTVLKFVNNDVMPHKLVQTAGPKLRLGRANMNHIGASMSVKFMQRGVYRFKTRPGEDYKSMAAMKTTGEDYVLHLTVRVK